MIVSILKYNQNKKIINLTIFKCLIIGFNFNKIVKRTLKNDNYLNDIQRYIKILWNYINYKKKSTSKIFITIISTNIQSKTNQGPKIENHPYIFLFFGSVVCLGFHVHTDYFNKYFRCFRGNCTPTPLKIKLS